MDHALNKPKHTGTKQIFENPLLEKLSRTHIAVPISMFLLISAGLLYTAVQYTTLQTGAVVALFFGGLLFWTFMEYVLHRFVFHMEPTTEWKRKLQYAFHGVHHEYPKDKTRLAMPPLMSIVIAALLFAIIYLLINTSVFGFLPGLLTGYAAYLFVHYIVHAYPPPKNAFKELWVSHAVHHYKDNTKLYGVSSP
ncbi:MAG: fatty acid hydroxylase [Cytophagaceae bacterium]|nr:fatty acid hydroxylase [Cytophagaceae bacterium]